MTSTYDSCHGHDCMIVRLTGRDPMVAVMVMIV